MAEDQPTEPRDATTHEQAIAHAQARRLVQALAPFGILEREALQRACGAHHWHDGGFTAALSAAIDAGMIDELPGGFYRDARHLTPHAVARSAEAGRSPA